MDPRSLKKIVEIMNENDLAEVEIEEEGRRLRVRKMERHAQAVPPAAVPPAPPADGSAPARADAAPADTAPRAADGLLVIKAPMVGTFYRAPAPDADSYVDVGVRVNAETVVCILEAMKVMNEIKAECTGEIVKVCVENGEAVEYDQDLFVVQTG